MRKDEYFFCVTLYFLFFSCRTNTKKSGDSFEPHDRKSRRICVCGGEITFLGPKSGGSSSGVVDGVIVCYSY